MKITKFCHCCLLIKENGVTLLTDPGSFTSRQNEVTGIDAVLITHEHQDHLHIESLKKILKNNPNALVITNGSVGKILDKENLAYKIVADGDSISVKGVSIEGSGKVHAIIHPSMQSVENTGYFINKKLFYPGDAFYDPKREVDVLALPVAAPWLKISEVIDYALAVKPKKAFPVHDGMMNEVGIGFQNKMLPNFFGKSGIEYVPVEIEKEFEI